MNVENTVAENTQAVRKKSGRRRLGNSLRAILFLLLIVIIAFGFVVGTETGTRWSLQMAQTHINELSIEQPRGSWWRGVHLDQLRWQQDDLSVTIEKLATRWRTECLWRNTFCIEKLAADTVSIQLKPVDTKSNADTSDQAIELPSVVLPVGIELNDLTVGRIQLDPGNGSEIHIFNDIKLALVAERSQVELHTFALSYKQYSATLQGSIDTSGDYPLDFLLSANAAPLYEQHNQNLSLRFGGNAKKLTIEGNTAGIAEAKFLAELQPLDKQLPYSLKINWEQIDWPPKAQQIISRNGEINIDGSLQTYSVNFSNALEGGSIPAASVQLQGEGDFAGFQLEQLSIKTLDGQINAAGSANWSDGLQWSITTTINDINPGDYWEDFPGEITGGIAASGEVQDKYWALNIEDANIDGQIRDYPLTLKAALNRAKNGQLNISQFLLKNDGNFLQFAGVLRDQWQLDGELSIVKPQALWPDLEGVLAANIAVRGKRELPDIKISADADSWNIQGVSIDAIDIQGDIVALGKENSNLAINLMHLNTKAMGLEKMAINFSGSRAEHRFLLSTDGDIDSAISIQGTLDDALNWLGELNTARVNAYQQAWAIKQPTTLQWHNHSQLLQIAAHCWIQTEAQVCLKEDATFAEDGDIKFSVRNFSLASLKEHFPQHAEFSGIVSGDGSISWQAEKKPVADIQFEVTDGGVKLTDGEELLELNYRKLSADIIAEQNAIGAKLALSSDDMGDAKANIVIDPASENKTISGDILLQKLELVAFKAFFPQLKTLEGVFSANGKISGNLSAPRYVGNANIANINIAADQLPIAINDGFLQAQVDGTRADIDAGWHSNHSPVTLNGNADWGNIDKPVVNLALEGKEIDVRQAPTVAAKVSPTIQLSVNGQDIRIDGRVEVPYARITLQELPSDATQISQDVIVVTGEEKNTSEKKGPRVTTNATVVLGEDVRFEGLGLRASLAGGIEIEQKPQGVPLLAGEVLVPDGIYKAYGQNLTIQRGRLIFVGPIDETAIDIDASRTIESVTAGLHVRGSIKSPEITLFSSPQQTQENTLSYIVLGKPIGAKGGSSEAGLLTQAAVAMGIKGGRGIATNIAEQFGIQDFQIDTVGDGDDSQVQLSGRLSPDLLLSYGVGVLTPVNTLTLRYNLTERFYVETAQSVESALDFFYSVDF